MVSGTELSDGHDLVELAASELLELDQENELLKYWTVREGENPSKKEQREIRRELKERFYGLNWQFKPNAYVWERIYASYYATLELEINRIKLELQPHQEGTSPVS